MVACTVYLGCEIHLSDGPARQPNQTNACFCVKLLLQATIS